MTGAPDHDAAVETAANYAAYAAKVFRDDLLRLLGLKPDDPDLRAKLAPFAPVWAAMIAAAAQGHQTLVLPDHAARTGRVGGQ